MTFKIIDKTTGKEPTSRVIRNIAKNGGLMEMDIDQFFVGEDGTIVLADDCGRMAYVDMDRFEVQPEQKLATWVTGKNDLALLFCNSCGYKVNGRWKYCPNCGAKRIEEET